MKSEPKQALKRWENCTEELATAFVNHYFGPRAECDTYWVADQIGDVFYCNDYFFSTEDMVQFIRNNYSKKKMFEYYNYSLDERTAHKIPVNIKNYLKLSKPWVRHYRDDKGIWEDICPHGIGHDRGIHGCDGCCTDLYK